MSEIPASREGFIELPSEHSVTDTLDRLEAQLKERGVLVFCRINFSADAERAGLAMRPEQLLIFGNPKAGTALMAAAPSVGLDLPLKVLAWEDANSRTWIAFNSANYITQRHRLPAALNANLEAVVPLIQRAAGPDSR
jgi:uncharacterized protein (DUF302 family)